MALRLGSLYDALRAANIPEERARAAAEEVAGYENRLAAIDQRLTVLTWMVGTLVAITLALFWQSYTILARLPHP